MQTFSRIAPFVWPYRRYVVMSVLCAVMISAFWAGNLSATLPLVRVLFESDRNLHAYVADEIAVTQTEIRDRNIYLAGLAEDEVERRAKAQRDQSAASTRLAHLTTIQTFVMPWVPEDRFDTVALILGGLFVTTLFKGVFIYLQEVLVGCVVGCVIVDIRKLCFRKTLALDYQTVTRNGSSNVISRMTNDVEQLASGIRTFLVRLIREPLKAGGCVLFAFWLNWRLTLMAMLVLPIIALAFGKFGRKLKRASRGNMESMSGILKCLTETMEAIKVVIAFGGGRRHRQQFHRTNRDYFDTSMSVIRVSALARPTTELMGVLAVLIAVLPGTYLVLRSTDEIWGIQLAARPMEFAELSALYALLAGTLDSIRKLSTVYGDLKRSSAAADRILELLDADTHVPEPATPRVIGRHSSEIRFDNVSFSYEQEPADEISRPAALQNVDLTVQAGEVVAVIGENGSGKSTLINLVPRFADPSQGRILVDGVDLREMKTRELRGQIGLVTQETLLFDDTIYENIRYGRPDATWEEIEDAARQAHVIPFITQLPDGFDTRIGEKGRRLSGGQRQRIALARAIIRDPSILILDEATSAVDSQSEQLIHRVLKEFTRGRTVFIITHVINDTFLDLVTRIVVMEKGHMVANGTHEELLQTCPGYQRLYQASAQQRAA
ncbi:MAG: ABC transporter ATP-binding protein [Planctomycetota bacterium]|jgi:subfamily B ATP-binding cassette protein MsbA